VDQAHTLTLPPSAGSDISMNHEAQIARHIARHAVLLAPAVILVAGILRGVDGAISAAIGLVLVSLNFLAAAAILSWATKRGPGAIYAAILGGFIGRLAVIVGIVFALEPVAFIDIPVLVLTIAVTHIALLWWETRYVSLTLAAPGLKPGVGNPTQDEE
jgi:hypothetical protein